MLKKKLAVTIASIAAASFILGTLLNLDFITTAKQDDGPMPVWPTYITGVNATALPETWNVTVTNWPVSTAHTVWWQKHLDTGISYGSGLFYANGFSQLHVLVSESGLGMAETVHFWIYGMLWDSTHTSYEAVLAAEITLDGCDTTAAMTIPIPSEEFYFVAYTIYECDVSLSFYLTWA